MKKPHLFMADIKSSDKFLLSYKDLRSKNVSKWNDSPLEMLKSPEHSNCHEPLSQEWINGRYQTSKKCYIKPNVLAVTYLVTGLD